MMNQTKKPLVSVVIPNYNGEKFVEQTIQSALRQTYDNVELILVDDKSTDGSLAILRNWREKDKRIRLIEKQTNTGVALTRNAGIDAAKGEYIALLDNDDLWEEDKIERQVELIQRTKAGMVYCSYDFIDECGQEIGRPFIVPEQTTYHDMLAKSVIGCSSILIATDIIKKNKFSGAYYHEDYVLWMKLLEQGIMARGDVKVLMHYRRTAGSRSNSKFFSAKQRWVIYRKALHLGIGKSAVAFFRYMLNGIIKYYL